MSKPMQDKDPQQIGRKWSEIMPSEEYVTNYMVTISLLGLTAITLVKGIRSTVLKQALREAGVRLKKVQRTTKEIERKVFHLCGLVVPLIYQMLLRSKYSHSFCCSIVWTITIVGIVCDLLRVNVPIVARNWPLKSILREKEQDKLCGGCWFSLGCTLAIQFFSPAIAMTSINFLVVGDMMAALFGVAFGRQFCVVGVGRDNQKSVEGSVGMFMSCFIVGCTMFSQSHLREYPVFLASLIGTLTELYLPLGIDDNVSIPVISGLTLTYGFSRISSCVRLAPSLIVPATW